MDKRRLGRGLDSLLGSDVAAAPTAAATQDQATIPVERIAQNPHQPRQTFDGDELGALSSSLKTHGMLQPIVVRADGSQYRLVAGERRLRAAQAAGMTEVPVRIVSYDDQQAFEATLVENLHREDLNPIEKAQGFKQYIDLYQVTQDVLAERLCLDRTTITNLINLLELPMEVQDAIRLRQITMGHAKALRSLYDSARQLDVCKKIIAHGLSVHATEELVRKEKAEVLPRPEPESVEKTSHVKAIEDALRQRLATRVEIRLKAKDRGQIMIRFNSNDDFERILDALRINYH